MPNELKNVDVHLISFVDKAANKRTFVYKSLGAMKVIKDEGEVNLNDFTLNRTVKISKIDDEKRLVYGVVYSPDEEDAHDDFMTEAEVEKAAHNFLAKSNTVKATDTQHNLEPAEGVKIVESAVLKGEHEILKDEKLGSWYIVTKVENDEIWKSVKDGTYTGFSLYGFAERVEEAAKSKKAKGKKFSKLMERIEKWFDEEESAEDESPEEIVKGFNEVYQRMKLGTVVDAISSAVYQIRWDDFSTQEEKKAEIIRVLEDAKSQLESIDLTKSEVIKAGKTISAANQKKIADAIALIGSLVESAGSTEEKKEKFKSGKTAEENNTMETIEKKEHDKIVADKDAEIKAEQEKSAKLEKDAKDEKEKADKLEKEFGELKTAVETMLEKSPGSQQPDGDGADGEAKKSVQFNILGDEIKKKFNIK